LEFLNKIKTDLVGDEIENKIVSLEKDEQVDRLLAELKARRAKS
jgi:hypothetical protein